MKYDAKYDAKIKKQITNDWAKEFPSFKIWKPTRIIRRHGPLIVGICLDSTGNPETYNPTAHIHNLCQPFPTISLALEGRVLNDKGLPIDLKVKNHSETYLQFASKIKQDYPYTNKLELAFNDLVIAIHKYITGRTLPYQHAPFNDIVTISAFLGKIDYSLEAIEGFTNFISKWPDRAYNIIGSTEKWRNGLLELIHSPAKLQGNVKQEIVKHKLVDIFDNGLIWPEKPMKLWEMPCKCMFG